MKACPAELRARIVAAVERVMTYTEVAQVFAVSERTIRHDVTQQRLTHDLTPSHSPGRTPTIGLDPAEHQRAQVTAHPDATLAQCQARGVTVSVATMSHAIRRLAIACKKVLFAAEHDEAVRAACWETLQTHDPATLVFVDESGTNLAMTLCYGRTKRGHRVVATAPRNHGPNTTVIAALHPAGIHAAMTVEGAIDRLAFDAFVQQVLVPSLVPGQTVIWDNLRVYQSATAHALIEAAGCQVCFLPPYSPNFAPIELAFSTLNTFLRRRQAHTRAAFDEAISAGLATITPADAHGWFTHCGYPLTGQPNCQLL
jgi:transposase